MMSAAECEHPALLVSGTEWKMDPAALGDLQGGRRPRTVGNDEPSDNETRPPSPMEAPAEEQTTSSTMASISRHMRDHVGARVLDTAPQRS